MNVAEKSIQTTEVDHSKVIYFDLISKLNFICGCLQKKQEVNCQELLLCVEKITKKIKTSEHMLMGLAQAPLTYVEKMTGNIDYPEIAFHGVSTMIYALQIANSLGFPEDETKYLGIASLFQNIGLLHKPPDPNIMENFEDVLRKLNNNSNNAEEYLKLVNIESLQRESIENIIGIIQSRKMVLFQNSLGNILQQYAMIIHICNIFVFLTHALNVEKSMSPSEAMKAIRSEMRDFFHPEVIKLFFNKLSIYPIGTFVKLSSGEIAKIVDINENFLMRPLVLIVLGSDNQEKIPKQRLNLRENPNIYIKESTANDILTERFIDSF
jgi:hypothetical protein